MIRAEAHHVVVTPTGDSQESQRGDLFIVHTEKQEHATRRGVVEHVGAHVADIEQGLEPGCVLHYTSYWVLGDKHIVSAYVAWEPNET